MTVLQITCILSKVASEFSSKGMRVGLPSDQAIIQKIWHKAVDAVGGHTSVASALHQLAPPPPDGIVAIGKAAAPMMQAAIAQYRFTGAALVVTKYDHLNELPTFVQCVEAAHPVPDENSLIAGDLLQKFVTDMPSGSHLLVLVSGGASALAERPNAGLTLQDLAQENNRMLAAGLDIHAMNAHRKTLSQIKGGKLLAGFGGRLITTLAISDVEGDDLSVIGSGIGDVPAQPEFDFSPHIVASNFSARQMAVQVAANLGLNVLENAETLYGDIHDVAPRIAQNILAAGPGVHIFGGEPTVVLPNDPGRGGRNQALALLMAKEIQGMAGISVLVAGTDGSDGPTDAAGAVVCGKTWGAGAQDALATADSGTWLDRRGALLRVGPTGTNVMDLLIALRT